MSRASIHQSPCMAASQVDTLRHLVRDVLMPAYNAFDRRESDALSARIAHEEARQQLPARDAAGGARTSLAAQGMRRKAMQQRRALTALLNYLEIDPCVLHRADCRDGSLRPLESNWLHEVYQQFRAVVPEAVWNLHQDQEEHTSSSSKADMAILLALSSGKCTAETLPVAATLLQPHRQRGRLPIAMKTLSKLVVNPLCQLTSYAVPCEGALVALAELAPLIECGAGTGYWSALLQQRGVDVAAFDAQPPTELHNNAFFHGTYCDVEEGDGARLFARDGCEAYARRTLLLVWPNNPDEVDNRHLAESSRDGSRGGGGLPPVWDADCLASYMRAGGQTVVYVGEREEQIVLPPGATPECGASASRRFQAMLAEHFHLQRAIAIPTWGYNVDDLTIWTRRDVPASLSCDNCSVSAHAS